TGVRTCALRIFAPASVWGRGAWRGAAVTRSRVIRGPAALGPAWPFEVGSVPLVQRIATPSWLVPRLPAWAATEPGTWIAHRAGTTTATVSAACAEPAQGGSGRRRPSSRAASPIRPVRFAISRCPLYLVDLATAIQCRASEVPRIEWECHEDDALLDNLISILRSATGVSASTG